MKTQLLIVGVVAASLLVSAGFALSALNDDAASVSQAELAAIRGGACQVVETMPCPPQVFTTSCDDSTNCYKLTDSSTRVCNKAGGSGSYISSFGMKRPAMPNEDGRTSYKTKPKRPCERFYLCDNECLYDSDAGKFKCQSGTLTNTGNDVERYEEDPMADDCKGPATPPGTSDPMDPSDPADPSDPTDPTMPPTTGSVSSRVHLSKNLLVLAESGVFFNPFAVQ